MDSQEKLRYPVGRLHLPKKASRSQVSIWIATLSLFPQEIENRIAPLSTQELHEWTYRPGGWSIAQVIHHCADTHMQSYGRFKRALTEDNPVIHPYQEGKWANLPDSELDPGASLSILKGLHLRWVAILKRLTTEDLDRTFFHTEMERKVPLMQVLAMYDWHCRHHLAHLDLAIRQNAQE